MDRFLVIRLFGYFTMPGTNGVQYDVSFYNNDDGTLLKIDNQEIVNEWGSLVNETTETTPLIGGQTYFFERFLSEWAGGARLIQKWNIDGIHNNEVFMNRQNKVFMNRQNKVFHYSN